MKKIKRKTLALLSASLGIGTLSFSTLVGININQQVQQNESSSEKATQENEVYYAHRGYNSKFPENTELSYQGAVDAGFNGVETDVHLSKDGVAVINHDETIDRTVKGGFTGRIDSYTLAELKEFDFSKGYDVLPQRIWTLKEFAEKFNDKFDYFNIEIKGMTPGIEAKTWEVIKPYTGNNEWMVQSFNPINIINFGLLNTGIRIGYLALTLMGMEEMKLFDYITDLNPNYALIALNPKEFVNTLNEHNLNTSVWTIDSELVYNALRLVALKYGFNPRYISNYAIFSGDFE